jgi:hypothetical protein
LPFTLIVKGSNLKNLFRSILVFIIVTHCYNNKPIVPVKIIKDEKIDPATAGMPAIDGRRNSANFHE